MPTRGGSRDPARGLGATVTPVGQATAWESLWHWWHRWPWLGAPLSPVFVSQATWVCLFCWGVLPGLPLKEVGSKSRDAGIWGFSSSRPLPNPAEEPLQAAEHQLAWPGSRGMAGSNENKDSQQEQNVLLFISARTKQRVTHPLSIPHAPARPSSTWLLAGGLEARLVLSQL